MWKPVSESGNMFNCVDLFQGRGLFECGNPSECGKLSEFRKSKCGNLLIDETY
jgi:hypothetical protein